MTFYSAPVESFLKKMSNPEFGIFFILGKQGSGKTTMAEKYLQEIPDSVRKAAIRSKSPISAYEEKNLSSIRVASSSQILLTFPLAMKSRSSAISLDVSNLNIPPANKRQIFEDIAMASMTTNIVMTLECDDPEEFYTKTRELFSNPSSKITYYGFLKRIKGFAFLEKDFIDNTDVWYTQCLEFDSNVQECIDREHSSETLYPSLDALGSSQGYLTTEEQKSNISHVTVTRATALAWKEFQRIGKNISVVAGSMGAGKTSLGNALANLAEKNGEKVLYLSDDVPLKNAKSHEGFAECTLLVLDEVTYSENLLDAIELAKTKKILFNIHASDHFNAIKSIKDDLRHMSEESLDVFNRELGLVILIHKNGVKRKSIPFIIEDKEAMELENIMNLNSSTASMLVAEMISDQGF